MDNTQAPTKNTVKQDPGSRLQQRSDQLQVGPKLDYSPF